MQRKLSNYHARVVSVHPVLVAHVLVISQLLVICRSQALFRSPVARGNDRAHKTLIICLKNICPFNSLTLGSKSLEMQKGHTQNDYLTKLKRARIGGLFGHGKSIMIQDIALWTSASTTWA